MIKLIKFIVIVASASAAAILLEIFDTIKRKK